MTQNVSIRCTVIAALLLVASATRLRAQEPVPEPTPELPAPPVRADSAAGADSVVIIKPVAAPLKARAARPPRAKKAPVAETVTPVARVWPAPPAPLAGALLPAQRIIAFYGNPNSKRMGVLGALPPAQMLAALDSVAKHWAKADSTVTVRPALHLIVTVAQAHAGADGGYRRRETEEMIGRVIGWARPRGWLIFLDVQAGRSTVQAELPRLVKYLAEPDVHLALDPEFTMPAGKVPGRVIGTMDAATVNHAVDLLGHLVDSLSLPPKVLVVHRFTDRMLTNAEQIKRDPRVQVVVDMDGFGSPELKRATWRRVIIREPVQYTGFKLFFKNDQPMMEPKQVIQLWPAPHYIQYQ